MSHKIPPQKHRRTPFRLVVVMPLLVATSCGLLTGCAMQDRAPRGFSQQSISLNEQAPAHSTGKPSQEITVVDGRSSETHADYGTLQSRYADAQDLKTVTAGNPEVTGHSFLQPRARLGRPILLPAAPATAPRFESEPDSTRQSAGVTTKTLESSSSRSPWPVETSADPGRQSTAEVTPDRGGWSPTTVWQPLERTIPDAASGSRGDGTLSDPAFQDESSIREASESRSAASNENPAELSPLRTSESSDPESTAEGSGQTSTDGSQDALVTNGLENPPLQEPTMLDRLRGLTAPRLDDNTEKLRKQFLRMSDPFKFLRDRNESTGAVNSAVPEAVPGSEIQVADAAAVQSGTASSPSSPTSPLDAVIAELETELQAWPKTSSGRPERLVEWRRRQTDLRMLYLVAGRSAESVRVIEALPEEEQEFWQSLMLSVNSYRESTADENGRARLDESLNHLRTATRRLQPLSTLRISRLTFCDHIDGFGNVSEFPSADFDPGQRVLVYAEVQNFKSELKSDGRYHSEFAAVLEFRRDADEEVLDTIRLPQIQDACSVERSDYFQSYELTVPALAGRYQVRLRLRDQLSLQTTEAQLEFHVR